jgi:hypothetical protein
MAGTAPIPENRPLSAGEQTLVRWMLERGTVTSARFLSQLPDARVVSRCHCGCASVDFSVKGVVPPPGDGIGIIADFEYRTAEGYLCGAFVFERGGLLAGLEVWSVDGLTIPSALPAVEQLRSLGSEALAEPVPTPERAGG